MQTKARFVWLHGFGSGPSSSKASYVRARLAELGFSLEAPDLNEPAFFDLTVSRMLARLDVLSAESPAPLALIGSSLGGYVAALWAADHPERVARLALLAPAFDLAHRWSERMGESALTRWREQGWFEFDHFADHRKLRLSSAFLTDAALHAPFPLPRAPTLLYQGLRDDTLSPELAREQSRRMREANLPVRLIEVDQGHELTADLPALWRELELHFGPELGAAPRPTP